MTSSPSQSSLFFAFVYACLSFTLMVGSKPTFVSRMIHYQSPESPMFNPNATTLERSRDDLARSMARAGYVARGITTSAADMEARITAYFVGFLVNVEFGSRAISQWLILDTGSPLTWIHCKPSEVPNVPTPLFNSHESRSFQLELCHDGDTCKNAYPVNIWCLPGRICDFSVQYGSGKAGGIMGRDSLRFGDGILTNVTFGCTKRSNIHMKINRLLGLRWRNISLLVQKHVTKFGYCIGSLNDRSFNSNTFVMGDGVRVLGVVTQLYVKVHYVVSVEGIRMGGITLAIDPKILRVNHFDGSGGAILDSGSTYTFLPKAAVENIEQAIQWQLQDFAFVQGRTYGDGLYDLKCYRGSVYTDLGHFPMVEIVFEDEAVLQLAPLNLFRQFNNDVFCLAFIPKENANSDRSIIGNIMQQGFYVAFDVEGGRVGFASLDCAFL